MRVELQAMAVTVANLGFQRIGRKRELKRALERYWSGETDAETLLRTGARLRAAHWRGQSQLGVDHIPSNDFSLYDHVLDTAAMAGAIPPRFGWPGGEVGLDAYFAMARGAPNATAAAMTKWFDTNYHYLAP